MIQQTDCECDVLNAKQGTLYNWNNATCTQRLQGDAQIPPCRAAAATVVPRPLTRMPINNIVVLKRR